MKIEEITEHLGADKEALQGVLTFVKDTEEGKELLRNHANAHFEEHLKPKIKEVYDRLDNDMQESLGERKPDGVKSYEFLKDRLSELKKLRTEVGALKENQGSNDKVHYWKEKYETSLQQFGEEKNSLQKAIDDLKQSQSKSIIRNWLKDGLSGLEFSVPKEAVEAMIQLHTDKAIKNAQIIDDNIVLHNEDGSIYRNTEYKPISAKEYWQQKLNSVIKVKSNGGGSAPVNNRGNIVTVGQGEAATQKLVLDKSTFSTKHQFYESASKTLIAQGVAKDSEEWNSLIDEARKEYQVSELPLR